MDAALQEQLKQARRRVARLESDLKDAHEDLTELEALSAARESERQAQSRAAARKEQGFADE